jgi:hypothetical protein
MTRRWSLMGVINQKQTRPQDDPVRFQDLPPQDRKMVRRRYPEFK